MISRLRAGAPLTLSPSLHLVAIPIIPSIDLSLTLTPLHDKVVRSQNSLMVYEDDKVATLNLDSSWKSIEESSVENIWLIRRITDLENAHVAETHNAITQWKRKHISHSLSRKHARSLVV